LFTRALSFLARAFSPLLRPTWESREGERGRERSTEEVQLRRWQREERKTGTRWQGERRGEQGGERVARAQGAVRRGGEGGQGEAAVGGERERHGTPRQSGWVDNTAAASACAAGEGEGQRPKRNVRWMGKMILTSFLTDFVAAGGI
jgi:hypothetical protein